MSELTELARRRKLAFAELAHKIWPNVPISWLWLLEWASGIELLHGFEIRRTQK